MEEGGSTPLLDSTLYKQLIGSLLYLTNSRPDLSYVMSVFSRFMQEPHELHWKETKRTLHYLKGTIELGIHYFAGAQLYLISFTDPDLAGDNIDRKYTPWFVFMLGHGLIYWLSKNQAALALSLAKAEY